MRAWNGWYHVSGHTYGTWLPGDTRGWRTRRHRQHVEGDYTNPPPSAAGAGLRRTSKRSLAKGPVHLTGRQSRLAIEGMVEKLREKDIDIVAASMDAVHYHLLARFDSDDVRRPMGLAKKNASFLLSRLGLPGTVWAQRCRPEPITGRSHQLNTLAYILAHAERGAWVWDFRRGYVPPATM